MTVFSGNIAIAGAGIMGLMAGFMLSRRFPEAKITIFDPRGFPADNASALAGGMLAPYAELDHMPPAFLSAGLESIHLWQEMELPVEFKREGSLLLAHAEDIYILERFAAYLKDQPDCKTLSAADIADLEPNLGTRFSTGFHLAQEAHINPFAAMKALADALPYKEACALDIKRAAKDYDYVIDCRGYAAADNDADLRGVKGEMAIVRNPEFTLTRPVRLMHPRYPLYIVPRADNIFMIGATQIEGAGDEDVSVRAGLELMSALYALHPSFADAKIIEMRAGIRPAYPDNLPRIQRQGNILSCNGLFRHGFLLAPVMADGVADIIAGQNNRYLPLFTGAQHDHADHQRPEKAIRSAA